MANILTPRVFRTNNGTKRYYDEVGNLHRDDGPAVIYKDGEKWYCLNNSWSYHLGPSKRLSTGEMVWYNAQGLNRNDGVVRDNPNGYKRWNTWDAKGGKIWPRLN